MADGYNSCDLIGNLGSDPELKTTQGGKKFLKFSLATSESWKGQNGEKQEKTQWHACTLWDESRAEGLSRILAKGDRVHVHGKIEYSTYESNGEKRYRTDIRVSDVTLCGSKRQEPAKPRLVELTENPGDDHNDYNDLPF